MFGRATIRLGIGPHSSFRSFGGIARPGVVQSATCPVRELAIRKLAYPRVVQLPNGHDVFDHRCDETM